MDEATKHVIRFGDFELDAESLELRKGGALLHLAPQPAKVLAFLASHAGRLVTREELQRAVWGQETHVDFELGLNHCIKQAREALGDDVSSALYIQTIPRRGYRFRAPVERVGDEPDAAAAGVPERREEAGRSRTGRRMAALGGAAACAAALLMMNAGGARDRLAQLLSPVPVISSIAVLPLEDLSPDPRQGLFAEGMTDALITDLSRISALRVISRQSVMGYKGSKKQLPQIARELNVDAVVEGTVQRSGQRVRITVQLIHGKTDRHLWADSYERDFQEVLGVQSEVARSVAREVRIVLTPEERKQMEEFRHLDPDRYHLYLEGRHEIETRTRAGYDRGIRLFRQAVEQDPRSALAYAGLAEGYAILGFYSTGESIADNFTQARTAAQMALEIDGSLAEAHAALGFVQFYHDWNWPAAGREMRKALELKPSYAAGRHWYAEYLSAMGRHDEAIAEIRRAQELDPLSPLMRSIGCEVHFYARRYGEGLEHARKALLLDQEHRLGSLWLVSLLAQTGRLEEALKEFERNYMPRNPDAVARSAHFLALAGKKSQALEKLKLAAAKDRSLSEPASLFAKAYLAAGESGLAMKWLERAYAERDPYLVFMKVDPRWDELRSNPRFQEILERGMRFPK